MSISAKDSELKK